MDTVVGLDLGERCVGTRRALCRREPLPNRRGSRRSRRDVLRCDGRAGPRRIKLPQRLTRRRHDLHPACSGLADGNSVIIKQRMCGTSDSWTHFEPIPAAATRTMPSKRVNLLRLGRTMSVIIPAPSITNVADTGNYDSLDFDWQVFDRNSARSPVMLRACVIPSSSSGSWAKWQMY
jgi:hypothetical protein